MSMDLGMPHCARPPVPCQSRERTQVSQLPPSSNSNPPDPQTPPQVETEPRHLGSQPTLLKPTRPYFLSRMRNLGL